MVFGYSGDGINGIFGAMNRAYGKIKLVQVRHEEVAAFMASAYAKFSGQLGVCIGHFRSRSHMRIPAKADSRSGHGGQPRSEAT